MKPEETIDDALIAKYLAGEASPEEAMQLLDWVDQSAENKLLFEQSLKAWSLQKQLTEVGSDKLKTWNNIRKATAPRGRHLFFTPLRIAASVMILAAVVSVIYYYMKREVPAQEEWITKNSNQEIFSLSLPEGTSIVLNKNSTLVYPKEFKGDTRSVRLSGEGYFDVQHNPSQPFVITYDDINIKVLGTAFNVSYQESVAIVETQVTRGKVMMYNDNSSIVIEAGWVGSYEKKTKKFALRKAHTENHLGYATHTFTFENTSLKDVTDNLGNSFGVTFIFENEKLKDCRLTSGYQNKSLNFILDVIAESLNVSYTIKGNTVYLSGDGCL